MRTTGFKKHKTQAKTGLTPVGDPTTLQKGDTE